MKSCGAYDVFVNALSIEVSISCPTSHHTVHFGDRARCHVRVNILIHALIFGVISSGTNEVRREWRVVVGRVKLGTRSEAY